MLSIPATIKVNKNWLYLSALVLIVVSVFLLIQPVLASTESALLMFVGWLVMPIISFLGNVLLILIEILIGIFKFTDFIDTPAVQLGWVLVRDIANMAIVVALIIIAFATVFRIQRYAASQLLVKLIIAAVLVNFSLLIAGLLIDFGQVVMMTFVNAFDKLAAGNLTVGFGIEDMLKISTQHGLNVDSADVLGAMFLAVVLLVVAIAVILVFIVVLLQRIIYLWILAIFSPVAWVAPLLPGGGSYSSQWWSNFSKQVFIGPTLAFGFWLSMSVLAGISANQSLVNLTIQNTAPNVVKDQSSQIARFVSKASTPQAIFDFMVTIGLLLGTLMMARQAGGAAGSFASSTFGKVTGAMKGTAYKMSGLRAVREHYGAYRSMAESRRKEKVTKSAARMYGGVGRLKEGVGKFAKKAVEKPTEIMKKGVTKALNPLQSRAQKQRDKSSQLRQEAASLQQQAQAQQTIADNSQGVISNRAVAQRAAERLKQEAVSKEKEANKAESKAKSLDKTANILEKTGHGISQVVGKGLPALAAFATANPLPLGLYFGKKLEKEGKAQRTAGEQYKSREVNKERDAIKNAKDEDVLKQAEDRTATAFEQMAAILEMLNRDLYKNDEDVKAAKGRLVSLGADERTLSTADAIIERTRPTAAKLSHEEITKRIRNKTMDTGSLRAPALEANGGELIKLILKEAKIGQIFKLLESKDSEAGVKNATGSIIKDENYFEKDELDSNGVKTVSYHVIAGGTLDQAFNYDSAKQEFKGHGENHFKQALNSNSSVKMLLKMKTKDVEGDIDTNQARRLIAENMSKHQFAALAKAAMTTTEQNMVKEIADAIKELSKSSDPAKAEEKDIAKEVYEYIKDTPATKEYA